MAGGGRADRLRLAAARADVVALSAGLVGRGSPRHLARVHRRRQRLARSHGDVAPERPRCAGCRPRGVAWRHPLGWGGPGRHADHPRAARGPERRPRLAPADPRAGHGRRRRGVRMPARRRQPPAVDGPRPPGERPRAPARAPALGGGVGRQPARARGAAAGHARPGDGPARGHVRVQVPVRLRVGRARAAARRPAQLPLPDPDRDTGQGRRRPDRPDRRARIPARRTLRPGLPVRRPGGDERDRDPAPSGR